VPTRIPVVGIGAGVLDAAAGWAGVDADWFVTIEPHPARASALTVAAASRRHPFMILLLDELDLEV
jgi:hypothetical protein